jgi:hypothetical protein
MGYPTVSDRTRTFVRSHSEAHMNCVVSVYGVAEQIFDEQTGLVRSKLGDVLYSGKGRIYSIDGGGSLNIGEAVIATKSTYCSIPWDSPYIAVDSIVIINEMPGDTFNSDTTWRVLAVDGGGLMRATRRLQLVSLTTDGYWVEENPKRVDIELRTATIGFN